MPDKSSSNSKLSIPKNIGRLAIINQLGKGSMGVVYRGWDPYIERYVAIKFPLSSGQVKGKSISRYNQDFFREAQTAGRLAHPNIVAIYDADIYDKQSYIAMEYIEGVTLKPFCTKDKLLPVQKVIDIIFNTCRALDYAHNQSVIHWDIKPSNIMINRSGAIKVTDFSIARMKQDALKTMIVDSGYFIQGTVRYMSPQHFIDPKKIDHRSDIFSLGCVFYELLTGTPVFQGNNPYTTMYKITDEEPPSVLSSSTELPVIIDKIIKKALCKDPDGRYQSCMDFAYDLLVAKRHLKRTRFKEGKQNLSEYINNMPFFRNFSKNRFNQILKAGDIVRVSKGETIVSEGEIDDILFIILSGKVEVLKGDIRIDTIDRGDCFGEMAYLSGQPRAASIRALTDCTCLKISAALMDRLPEPVQILFMKSFSEILVHRISRNHKLILELLGRKK